MASDVVHSDEMTDDDFDLSVSQRLTADGAKVGHHAIGGYDCVTGYRSDFRLTWFATKLSLFTVVACAPSVDDHALEGFCDAALAFGIAEKGRIRGFQTGVGVIAVLASDGVQDSAIRLARTHLNRRWAAFAWPAVFDLSTGQYYCQEGSPRLGAIYNSWMFERMAAALPGGRARG